MWQWGAGSEPIPCSLCGCGEQSDGGNGKGRGHFRTLSPQSCQELVMIMSILILGSNFRLVVEERYSLSSLLPDWLSLWEHLFVGMCDFWKINLFPLIFPNLLSMEMDELWVSFALLFKAFLEQFFAMATWTILNLAFSKSEDKWKTSFIKLYSSVLW